MKTQTTSQERRQLNMRGQTGSREVPYVTRAIDLNWQRINERKDDRGRYFPNAKTDFMPAVAIMDAYPNLGGIFGDRIVVRGSPDYYF